MVIILLIAADERKYLLKQKLIMFNSNSGQRYGNTLRWVLSEKIHFSLYTKRLGAILIKILYQN